MQKWIHIAGIAGKATSNLALVYKRQGHFVTGSDNQCLPPATEILDREQIPYVEGFHYTHLSRDFWQTKLNQRLEVPEQPDLAIFGSTLSPKNKEYRYANLHGVKIQTFAQAAGQEIARRNSIVSVGTAGKTTTTALLVHLMRAIDIDPSYLIGAELADGMAAMVSSESDWSVMEGDEFYGPAIEPHSKFFEYRPKYLLLNKISWDHADVFATEADYVANFQRLLNRLPSDGLLLANAADSHIRDIATSSKAPVAWFSAYEPCADLVNQEGVPLYWYLRRNGEKLIAVGPPYANGFMLEFSLQLPGKYNQQNALAAVAMLYELFAERIDWKLIAQSLSNFRGIKKRLEVVTKTDKLIVVDDLGGPPLKVRSGIEAITENYPAAHIIAVYEPNSGNRLMSSLSEYHDTFKQVSQVIIPDLSESGRELLSGNELVEHLKRLGATNVVHVETDHLTDYIRSQLAAEQLNIVVFFSSYRFTPLAHSFTA